MSPTHTNVSQLIDEYDAWNSAIYAHFFGSSKNGMDVRLTFDDEAAAQVAEKFNATVDNFIGCVRGLVRPYLRDVFLRFRELSSQSSPFPRTLALLAAQVLVASRMASDSDFTAGAFWPRFNALFLCRGDIGQPGGYEYLRASWLEAGRFFNGEMGGSLGYLRLPLDENAAPLVNRNHINYPLSQCLVREVDRRDLAEFFLENSHASECDSTELLSVIADSIYAFGKSFASIVEQARLNRAFASELTRAILEIRTQVRNIVSGTEAKSTRRSRTRLKIWQRRGSFILSLQVKLDDWHLVSELNADEWHDGVSDDRGDSLWPGAELTAFIETADGFVTSRSVVGADVSRVRILSDLGATPEVKNALDIAGRDFKMIDVSLGLDGLDCFQFNVNPKVDEALLERFGLRSEQSGRIRLEGGLTNCNGRYVAGAAPRIVIDGNLTGTIILNKTPLVVLDDGTIQHPTDPGEYVIEAAGRRLEYSIVDCSGWADSSDGCEVGYIIGTVPPVMGTADFSAPVALGTGTKTLVGAEMNP